jgi:enediyne biosynthesis protein E4
MAMTDEHAGAAFYHNDGKGDLDDLKIPSGRGVASFPRSASLPPTRSEFPVSCFRNLGDGRFKERMEEAGSAVSAAHTSRGCAFGDFDNDGDLEFCGRRSVTLPR